jgi:hypothetical protein
VKTSETTEGFCFLRSVTRLNILNTGKDDDNDDDHDDTEIKLVWHSSV